MAVIGRVVQAGSTMHRIKHQNLKIFQDSHLQFVIHASEKNQKIEKDMGISHTLAPA